MINLISLSVVLLFMFGCAPNYMIDTGSCPSISTINSSNDMATLVIVRNGPFLFDVENYLDENIIGFTRGQSYFVTKVPSGLHFVTAKRDDNYDTALINFESGKLYYLINKVRLSTIDGPRARLDRLSDIDANKLFEDDCKHYVLTNNDKKLDKNDYDLIKHNYYEYVDLKSEFPTTSLVPFDRRQIITRISTSDSERLTMENVLTDKFANKYNNILISEIALGNGLLNNFDNKYKDNVTKLLPEISSLITNGVVEYINDKQVVKSIKNTKPTELDRVLVLELEIDRINLGTKFTKFLTWLTLGVGFSTGDDQTYIRVKGRLVDYTTKKEVATFESL